MTNLDDYLVHEGGSKCIDRHTVYSNINDFY